MTIVLNAIRPHLPECRDLPPLNIHDLEDAYLEGAKRYRSQSAVIEPEGDGF